MMSSNNGFLQSIPPVTKNIIFINLLFWLAAVTLPKVSMNLIGVPVDLTKWLGLHLILAPDFKLYQFVSYMFMHDTSSFTHLFFNMFSVYMFGRAIESTWGPKRFLIFYMITGIGAGVVQQVFWLVENQSVIIALSQAVDSGSAQSLISVQPLLSSYFSGLTDLSLLKESDLIYLNDLYLNMHVTVGASGAVFGILLAFAMLYPNTPLYLMFIPIPIKAKYFVVFYGLVELFMGVARFSGDNVAHFAHLGGILFGFILVKFWKKKDRDNGRYFY